MVYVELNGRLGNYLFQIATAASLASKNGSEFAVVCHDKYLLPDNSSIFQYIQQFKNTIFRNITILNSIPIGCSYFFQDGAQYCSIPYSHNIYLHGTFQSEKYFDSAIVRGLFKIPHHIKDNLYIKYGNVLSKGVTSIHVRRGDYLKRPHEYNITSMRFFKQAMQAIGNETAFLIISDDIEWCKQNFKGSNFYFTDNNTAIEDLYLQSLCKNNIISNSSFSWWGAWLNENVEKKVIAPKPWYGKIFSDINTDDLIPDNWIQIENRMHLSNRIKANEIKINALMKSVYYRFKRKVRKLLLT